MSISKWKNWKQYNGYCTKKNYSCCLVFFDWINLTLNLIEIKAPYIEVDDNVFSYLDFHQNLNFFLYLIWYLVWFNGTFLPFFRLLVDGTHGVVVMHDFSTTPLDGQTDVRTNIYVWIFFIVCCYQS